MYKTIVKVPPTEEPISRDEARSQLRIDLGDDDHKVASLISVARDMAENFCNRFFTEQTVLIVWNSALDGDLCLPFPDLQTINSVTLYDSEGVETVIPDTDYTFNSDLQKIFFNGSIPTNKSFSVEVVTGAPSDFQGAKIAMLMMLTDLYELRTESVVGATVSNNPAVKFALYPYRVNLIV